MFGQLGKAFFLINALLLLTDKSGDVFPHRLE